MFLVTIIDTNALNDQKCLGGRGVLQHTVEIDTQDLIQITNAHILDFTDIRS